MNKILLKEFDSPYQAFPFHQVQEEDYLPAIEYLLAEAKKEIEQIAHNAAAPTFENTLEMLESAGTQLNRVVEAFFNINSAETTDYLQEVAQKLAPKLAEYSNDIMLNAALFQRIRAVYEQRDALQLNKEQQRLLDKTYKGFVRNGALLDKEQQTILRGLDEKISVAREAFSRNVLIETNNFQLHLVQEEDIVGLPESLLESAQALAKEQGKDGYIFTLQFPSYVPFMKYAAHRGHRRTMYEAYMRRGFQQNEYNNESAIKDLTRLKDERSKLLGYKHHADYTLEERMAGTADAVMDFLENLRSKAFPAAQQELSALKSLALVDGIEELMPYDHAFYAEKMREKKYSYSEEELKNYFTLDAVLQAVFSLSKKLFGLEFERADDVPVYHPEVTVYRVMQRGEFKSLLYTDFHPRKGKRPGAWMTTFRGQYKKEGQNHRPHVSIVCNFSRATSAAPALLTFTEVTTLFHEFGHALHGMLADTHYESLSGTNVYWDFVELPSQFLENYCFEPDFLKTFARHWQSGETIPDALTQKIVEAAAFMEGYQTLRQLSFGLLDMGYYSGQFQPEEETVLAFERRITSSAQLYPEVPDTCMSTSFSHIFGGGYSAGYYSYKWSEVLDADAFSLFKENGIFDQKTAGEYEEMLRAGGTEDPMELFVRFRGRAPNPEALLERAGLTT